MWAADLVPSKSIGAPGVAVPMERVPVLEALAVTLLERGREAQKAVRDWLSDAVRLAERDVLRELAREADKVREGTEVGEDSWDLEKLPVAHGVAEELAEARTEPVGRTMVRLGEWVEERDAEYEADSVSVREAACVREVVTVVVPSPRKRSAREGDSDAVLVAERVAPPVRVPPAEGIAMGVSLCVTDSEREGKGDAEAVPWSGEGVDTREPVAAAAGEPLMRIEGEAEGEREPPPPCAPVGKGARDSPLTRHGEAVERTVPVPSKGSDVGKGALDAPSFRLAAEAVARGAVAVAEPPEGVRVPVELREGESEVEKVRPPEAVAAACVRVTVPVTLHVALRAPLRDSVALGHMERVGSPDADMEGVCDEVALRAGEAEALPPTGWAVGKGSQEPSALRGVRVAAREALWAPLEEAARLALAEPVPVSLPLCLREPDSVPLAHTVTVVVEVDEGRGVVDTVGERVPPPGWSVGKGSREPIALRAEGVAPREAAGALVGATAPEALARRDRVEREVGEAPTLLEAAAEALPPPSSEGVGATEGVRATLSEARALGLRASLREGARERPGAGLAVPALE